MTAPSNTVQNQTNQNLLIETKCKPYLDEIEKKVRDAVEEFLGQHDASYLIDSLTDVLKTAFIDAYNKEANSKSNENPDEILRRLNISYTGKIQAIALNLLGSLCNDCLREVL